MLVPGHIVSMYVATCGQNGPALGSDEKEIILLVYVIIDSATAKVIGVQQYLVRPLGSIGIDRSDEAILPANPDSQTCNEIPIAIAQTAGRPLKEVIEQFDDYIRSLSIDPNSPNFRLITDGQLPIRQCLHPEAWSKDINLPSYYYKFSDLRKEYVRYKSADLSRALVPVKDIKKLPQMPTLPPLPLSISDMKNELGLTTYEDADFYIKESRDMVTVIQTLLAAGHKFEANEIVNLNLEPGICSIDDEIDGSCIVRARGLPWQSSDQDIAKFFIGLNVAKGGVALCLSPLGRRNGEALVRFISQEHRDMALKRHKHHIGLRYIEVYRATGEDFLAVAGGASNEAQTFLSKGAQVIIRMRGLPYDCTAKQVLDFFSIGENPCHVLDGNDGVLFVKKPDGRATGDAFVLFSSESDAPKALSRHRESIGQRYIELFRSTTAEVQQVLNRSMDPKTYDPPQPPLIAQLPAVQMPFLPQHVITSGTTKNCIRLRGLPYEAKVEHILHFLEDFAKNILYQGVHMVYNAQGQPSGEAFIQMDSEEAARASAQQKHNQFMIFGKKYRYIEVFQCSGDDMNLVLNGGIQSPVNSTKPPLLSPGMLPQIQQVTSTNVAQIPPTVSVAHHNPHLPSQHSHYVHSHHPAVSATHISHHTLPIQSASAVHAPSPLTLSIPPPSPAFLAQQQAQFIAQQNLLARQTAAAAAHNEHLMYPNLTFLPPQTGPTMGLQHTGGPSAGPQYFFMPRSYIHPLHLGLMPSPISSLSLATPGGISHSFQQTLPNSVKRSYDNAFHHDHSAVSAPKRSLIRPPSAIFPSFYHPPVTPPYGAYQPFGPPAAILSPSHRSHAFYPQPFVYWGYPSPPVSPTTYYGPPPPPAHIASNLPPHHQTAALSSRGVRSTSQALLVTTVTGPTTPSTEFHLQFPPPTTGNYTTSGQLLNIDTKLIEGYKKTAKVSMLLSPRANPVTSTNPSPIMKLQRNISPAIETSPDAKHYMELFFT